MKLIKLQSLANRSITNIELLSKYIFGDEFPTKFVNSKYYNAGDYAYKVSNTGDVQLYYCILSGMYSEITDNGWVVATLPSVVQNIVNNYLDDRAFPSDDNNYDVDTYVESPNKYQYMTYDNSDLKIDLTNNIIQIPIKNNVYLHHVELYIDDNRQFESLGDFTINGYNITVPEGHITNTSKIIVNILNKFDDGSKMLQYMEVTPTSGTYKNDTYTLAVPLNSKFLNKSLIFNVYYSHKYISEVYYSYKYNSGNQCYEIVIDMTKTRLIDSNSIPENFVVEFMLSTSKEVHIVKHDIYDRITTSPELLKIDLKYTEVNEIQNIHNCYDNGSLIPNTATTLYNDYVHITDREYSLTSNDFVISYTLLLYTSIYNSDYDGTNDYADEITLSKLFVDNNKVPVPFIGYKRDNGDIILFNENGKYINNIRYFVDTNNIVNFYSPMGLSVYERLLFILMDNDYSIHNYTKQIQLSSYDIKNGFKLPCLDFDQDAFDILVFKSTGEYIPSIKYELSDTNWLTFHADSGLSVSDSIDIIMLEYCASRTKTVMRRFSIVPKDIATMQLPFTFYQNDDNVFVFTHDGFLINPNGYTITRTGILTLNENSSFKLNEPVDVFLFRRHSGYKLIPDMKNVRKNLSTIKN